MPPRRPPSVAVRRPSSERPQPLWGAPLLQVKGGTGMVVATDIHVGLSRREVQGVAQGSGNAVELAAALIAGLKRARARTLLLLGDVKEPILGAPWNVRREVWRFFETLLAEGYRVEVTKGNHDIGLERMVPEGVVFHPARGFLRDGIGYFHGHAWPSPEVLEGARMFVTGHLHPGIRLAEGRQRCWIRVELPRESSLSPGAPHLREILVVPAFNDLCSGESLNVERPRQSHRFLADRFLRQGSARAYLLDGSDLGRLELNP
ncbi:MAG: metallophosphoesterase [Candidatus Thermoplasmatota archaeon]|nr:metallophosphoesterase [Candidatus Thermoplasmatota archaeon]